MDMLHSSCTIIAERESSGSRVSKYITARLKEVTGPMTRPDQTKTVDPVTLDPVPTLGYGLAKATMTKTSLRGLHWRTSACLTFSKIFCLSHNNYS